MHILSEVEIALKDYQHKIRLFTWNARLFLAAAVIVGLGLGVFRLLFNFYVLSLGFDEAFAGRALSVSSLTALLMAFPAGYLSDRFGRKITLVSALVSFPISILGLVLWPAPAVFYGMNALFGFGQSLWGVTLGPFLTENSGEEERTYLFSFSAGLSMLAGFGGNWVGGQLPGWIGSTLIVSPVSPEAYGGSFLVIAGLSTLGILPVMLIRRHKAPHEMEADSLSPFQIARQQPGTFGRLIGPMFVTALGAGLLMPFMNVFFRLVHGRSDADIGGLFAWGSLAMAIGLLVAPPIADRVGKITLVVFTQGLSIPFLIALGFTPVYGISVMAYLARLALMNMSTPVYEAFVMESVERRARATLASMAHLSWNFGWAVSPSISGWLQVRYGFTPVFLGTIALYILAIGMYWWFFLRRQDPIPEVERALAPPD